MKNKLIFKSCGCRAVQWSFVWCSDRERGEWYQVFFLRCFVYVLKVLLGLELPSLAHPSPLAARAWQSAGSSSGRSGRAPGDWTCTLRQCTCPADHPDCSRPSADRWKARPRGFLRFLKIFLWTYDQNILINRRNLRYVCIKWDISIL